MKRIIALVLSGGALTVGLWAFAEPAPALTCYRAGVRHLPNAWVQANPPTVTVDDGDPYIESYPC